MAVEDIGTLRGGIELKDNGAGTTVDQLIKRLEMLMQKSKETGVLYDQFGNRLQSTTAKINESSEATKKLAWSFDNAKEAALGMALGIVGGGGIAGAMELLKDVVVESVTAFADFENEMAKFQVLTGSSDNEIRKMGNSVRDLAIKYGRDPQGLATAMSEIALSFPDVTDKVQMLDLVIKGAKVNGTDYQTVIKSLDGVIDNFGEGAGAAADIMDKMTLAARASKMTLGEFNGILEAASPLASEFGLSFEELSAAIVTMGQSGVPASQAMMALRTTLLALDKPNKELRDAMGGASLSSIGFTEAMTRLRTNLADGDGRLRDMIPNAKAVGGVLKLAGEDGAKIFAEWLGKLAEAQDTVNKGNKTLESTTEATWERTLQFLKSKGMSIAQTILTPISYLAKQQSEVNKTFEKLGNDLAIGTKDSSRWDVLKNSTSKNLKDLEDLYAMANNRITFYSRQDYLRPEAAKEAKDVVNRISGELERLRAEQKKIDDAKAASAKASEDAKKKEARLEDENRQSVEKTIQSFQKQAAGFKSMTDEQLTAEQARALSVANSNEKIKGVDAATLKTRKDAAMSYYSTVTSEIEKRTRNEAQAIERIKKEELDLAESLRNMRVLSLQEQIDAYDHEASLEKTGYERKLELESKSHDLKIEQTKIETAALIEANDRTFEADKAKFLLEAAARGDSNEKIQEYIDLLKKAKEAKDAELGAKGEAVIKKELVLKTEVQAKLNDSMWTKLNQDISNNFQKWADGFKDKPAAAISQLASELTSGITEIGQSFGGMNDRWAKGINGLGDVITNVLSGNPVTSAISGVKFLGTVLNMSSQSANEAAQKQKDAAAEAANAAEKNRLAAVAAQDAAREFMKTFNRQDASSMSRNALIDAKDEADKKIIEQAKTLTGNTYTRAQLNESFGDIGPVTAMSFTGSQLAPKKDGFGKDTPSSAAVQVWNEADRLGIDASTLYTKDSAGNRTMKTFSNLNELKAAYDRVIADINSKRAMDAAQQLGISTTGKTTEQLLTEESTLTNAVKTIKNQGLYAASNYYSNALANFGSTDPNSAQTYANAKALLDVQLSSGAITKQQYGTQLLSWLNNPPVRKDAAGKDVLFLGEMSSIDIANEKLNAQKMIDDTGSDSASSVTAPPTTTTPSTFDEMLIGVTNPASSSVGAGGVPSAVSQSAAFSSAMNGHLVIDVNVTGETASAVIVGETLAERLETKLRSSGVS